MLINGMPYKGVTPYASIGASTTILGIAEKVWSIKLPVGKTMFSFAIVLHEWFNKLSACEPNKSVIFDIIII